MPPKNTSNQAYFSKDTTDKPHKDVEDASSSSDSANPETPPKQKNITTSDNPEDDIVAVSHGSPPSPTASDILLLFHFEDAQKAMDMNRKWQEEKLSDAERKAKLEELLELLFDAREVKEREEDEVKRREREEEEQGEGKGKGKKF